MLSSPVTCGCLIKNIRHSLLSRGSVCLAGVRTPKKHVNAISPSPYVRKQNWASFQAALGLSEQRHTFTSHPKNLHLQLPSNSNGIISYSGGKLTSLPMYVNVMRWMNTMVSNYLKWVCSCSAQNVQQPGLLSSYYWCVFIKLKMQVWNKLSCMLRTNSLLETWPPKTYFLFFEKTL